MMPARSASRRTRLMCAFNALSSARRAALAARAASELAASVAVSPGAASLDVGGSCGCCGGKRPC
eukprot:11077057-Heterocapsa_arctica.AAC.1